MSRNPCLRPTVARPGPDIRARFGRLVADLPRVLALTLLMVSPSFAQDPVIVDADHFRVQHEDDHVRVLYAWLEPGRASAHRHSDAVVVTLTADLDGRMPVAPAEWLSARVHMPENQARTAYEALIVELKQRPQGPRPMPLVVEGDGYDDRTRVTPLFENSQVVVGHYRLAPMAWGRWQPCSASQTILVYLHGGAMAEPTGRRQGDGEYGDRHTVRRGDVEVLAPGTAYRLSSMANDPIEFIAIQLR